VSIMWSVTSREDRIERQQVECARTVAQIILTFHLAMDSYYLYTVCPRMFC